MADPKDKLTTPQSDTKPARPAAVKPPVLEGKARPATADKPEPAKAAKQETGPDDKPKPDQPAKPELKPAVRPISEGAQKASSTPVLLAGVTGGVLGLGGAYALAVLGFWPVQTPPAPPADPLVAQMSAAVPELQTIADTMQSEVSGLSQRLAALENREPAGGAESVDLAPLNAELASLADRVEALASRPVAPGAVNTDNIAAIAALETELASMRESAASAANTLAGLVDRVAAIDAQQQASASIEDKRVRLPLILSGFETAFAAGRAYDGELAALRQVLPELPVPQTIAAGAMTGLKRPDAIVEAFNAALPDLMAVRPVDGEAGWQGATADWFRGVIALRPTGDVTGDGPEAVVARIEMALARRDFSLAQAEFSLLPEPMQAAAGATANDIAAQADAAAFLQALRQAALGQGEPE